MKKQLLLAAMQLSLAFLWAQTPQLLMYQTSYYAPAVPKDTIITYGCGNPPAEQKLWQNWALPSSIESLTGYTYQNKVQTNSPFNFTEIVNGQTVTHNYHHLSREQLEWFMKHTIKNYSSKSFKYPFNLSKYTPNKR
ncbi:MAG: hypothetical protein ACKVTZ_10645 [Bacteroidia bacterium]